MPFLTTAGAGVVARDLLFIFYLTLSLCTLAHVGMVNASPLLTRSATPGTKFFTCTSSEPI